MLKCSIVIAICMIIGRNARRTGEIYKNILIFQRLN